MSRKRIATPVNEEQARKNPTEYGEFKKGDNVIIANEPGTFRFMYATLNAEGDADTITVYGGFKGREKMRTFLPERVSAGTSKIRRRKRVAE